MVKTTELKEFAKNSELRSNSELPKGALGGQWTNGPQQPQQSKVSFIALSLSLRHKSDAPLPEPLE